MPKRKAVRSKKGATIKKGSIPNCDIVSNTSEDVLSSPAQEKEEKSIESAEKLGEDIATEGSVSQEECLESSGDSIEETARVVLPSQLESNDTVQDITEVANPQNTEPKEKCETLEHTDSQESEKNTAECELDVCEVKGAEDDEDEVQYIDEEAEEEQQLMDVMESTTVDKCDGLNNLSNTKLDISTKINDESKTETSTLVKSPNTAAKTAVLEVESSKFEEISEGSIDQTEQDDLINEESADVEITGVSFNPKENISQFTQSDFHLVKCQVPYSAAESLEEVFFATENDDLKIPAEDKDNDDISDSSFSDNGRTNMSLEEISDDDLEPSKKRRKSLGPMHEKRERSLRDIQSKAETKLVKGNEISEDSNKRLANAEEDEARITKRLKLSEEKDSVSVNDLSLSKNDTEVIVEQVKERNSLDLKLKTEILDKADETSSLVVFGGKSKKEDKSPTEVSKYGSKSTAQILKQDHYDGKDRIPTGRDYIEPRRRYELIHSSTQTEAKVLKGKIVQCNINPIDQYFESVKHYGALEDKFICSKLLNKFRPLLPTSIPVKIFTDITSVKPASKVHNYTFSMGPVTMSDMDSHQFRDVAVKGAERFHLAFDTHCQGIFQSTISKYENIASLIKSLKGLELGNRYMCMSFTYNLGTDKENEVWKATLLYMYEQDIHTESISLTSDDKIRSKLLLHGLPKGVSKDFINLLFPEALSVNTISGINEERVVALGFSNSKMVEEILTCYDLVIVNGCQVKITQVDLNDTSCETENSDVIIIDEDSSVGKLLQKDKEVMSSDKSADVYEVLEKRTENTETLTNNFTDLNNDNLNDIIRQDGDQTNTCVEENVILENSHHMKENVEAETNVALMLDDLNSENSADRKLDGLQCVDQQKVSSEEENAVQIDINDKCDISNSSSKLGEAENVNKENVDSLKDEAPKPTTDDKPTEVISDSTDVETDTKDVHLEDVSDDDMINQNKITVDNVVMIKEEPQKHMVVNIDLTNDDTESSENNTSSLKNPTTHDTRLAGEAAVRSSITKGEDERLVMTDGRLHVSMEVIDVSEDESSEKIIYSKYSRASSKKSKRILKERYGDHPITPHLENDPWVRHEHKRYDAYRSHRELYPKHPPKDDYLSRKSPHYQSSHSREVSQNKKMLSPRESSPRYRVPYRESTTVRREKFQHDARSRSPSPRKESNWYKETEVYRHSRSHYPLEYHSTSSGRKYSSSGQHSGTYDKWQPYTVDSRRSEYYSRQGTDSYARPPRSSTYHSYGSWQDHHHLASKSGEHILGESRDPGYGEKKYFQRRSRSQSYSDMSSSPDHHSPMRRKWSLEKSPKHSFKHTSRSPISVSSRSRSLSPVSKSPSLGRTQYKIPGKEALVSSVKQFLHLAKDLRQSKRQMRSITPELCSPVRSRSPGPYRVHSPVHSPLSPHRFEVSRSHQIMVHGSPRGHSRSLSPVWTRRSRSPNFHKSMLSRHHRSPSPTVDSRSKSYKKHDYLESRRDSYHREKESSRHEYSQRSRTKSTPSKDLCKSGQWSDQRQINQYGNSGEQSLQHSYGGYQSKSETGPKPQGSSFNPSYPPPSFPPAGYNPQETPSMYQGGSMYQYNNPGQYSYSNMPPNVTNPYIPPTPVSGMQQAYQQAFSMFQTAISSHPPPQAHYESSSSNNPSTSSKNKKSWSKGGSANIFQRVLGSDGSKKQSGAIQKIGDRERQERPKQTKEVRVLTNVPVNK